jgi:hypothetical protein
MDHELRASKGIYVELDASLLGSELILSEASVHQSESSLHAIVDEELNNWHYRSDDHGLND